MLPFALIDTSHGPGWIAAIPRANRVSQAISEWGVSILYRRTTLSAGLFGGGALVAVAALLTVVSGHRRTRDAVAVGAVLGAIVWVAPLVLGYLSSDYFLSRNVMPAVIPIAVAIAAACVAPRAWVLGIALAAALLAMFAFAAVRVQTHPYLQRPDWRAVAQALGPATVARAIFAADGTTADPLKIYLPRVAWTEPPGRKLLVSEIDVVGATKRLQLVPAHGTSAQELAELRTPLPTGSPVPRSKAPRGARLEARFRVHNWVLAKFRLAHPIRVSIRQLQALAPRFFRHTPLALLIFVQPRGH
jgi:hypothetical protein